MQSENGHHFLHSGEIFANREAHVVTTILGSCVSVCLWDPVLRMGGLNHYQLPRWDKREAPTPKYGDIAITNLIKRMLALGSRKGDLTASIIGGTVRPGALSIGDGNVAVAEEMLKDEGIPVTAFDVGGNLGRKLLFDTGSGKAVVKRLKAWGP